MSTPLSQLGELLKHVSADKVNKEFKRRKLPRLKKLSGKEISVLFQLLTPIRRQPEFHSRVQQIIEMSRSVGIDPICSGDISEIIESVLIDMSIFSENILMITSTEANPKNRDIHAFMYFTSSAPQAEKMRIHINLRQVMPSHRGLGLSIILLEYVQAIAAEIVRKNPNVEVDISLIDNRLPAVRARTGGDAFHESHGFSRVGNTSQFIKTMVGCDYLKGLPIINRDGEILEETFNWGDDPDEVIELRHNPLCRR